MNIIRIIQVLVVIFVAAVVFYSGKSSFIKTTPKPVTVAQAKGAIHDHMLDRAGVIPPQDLPRFEQYMGWIMRESGVDIRLVFLPSTGEKSIETLAVELMDQFQIGGRTGQERGVLLLYDMQGQRLKIEVGYGLEGWFPDAFVNYLVEDHARMFFSSGDPSLGLRLMLRLLQHRLREAVIGNDFDPRSIARVRPLTHLSGGAGVSAKVELANRHSIVPAIADTDSLAFPAGISPSETYDNYLKWLAHWPFNTNADLFTPDSRSYLASLRISPAYAEFILLAEYGKSFKIEERDDLALLYFTGTPFVSPHFLVRQDGRWRMDMVAEVQNTHEHVGGEYTWAYYGKNDRYTQTFSAMLATIKGYQRIREGDNRPLTIRGSY
jgi:uncharacterized protein